MEGTSGNGAVMVLCPKQGQPEHVTQVCVQLGFGGKGGEFTTSEQPVPMLDHPHHKKGFF